MFGLVTLLKYTQTTMIMTAIARPGCMAGSGNTTKATYLETLTRSLPKSRNDKTDGIKTETKKAGTDQFRQLKHSFDYYTLRNNYTVRNCGK